MKQSAVVRKGTEFLRRIPRRIVRWQEGSDAALRRPPILCNSVPKSGTHLLAQILSALPEVRSYGTFLASIPSVPYRERSPASVRSRLDGIVSGELVRAHVFWHPSYPQVVARRNLRHFLIYRDPRDVVVSEAYYLTSMNRWHRLHSHFRRLGDMEARFQFGIQGDPEGATGSWFPDIGARYGRFLPWIRDPGVCAIRFEDLVGEGREVTLRRILAFWALGPESDWRDPTVAETGLEAVLGGRGLVRAQLLDDMRDAIAPGRSHTFRRGETGAWRSEMSERNLAAFSEVGSGLLDELGYEPCPEPR